MFSSLNKNDKTIVIDAMERKEIKAGQSVIVQGEDGGELFVVAEGTLVCSKKDNSGRN